MISNILPAVGMKWTAAPLVALIAVPVADIMPKHVTHFVR